MNVLSTLRPKPSPHSRTTLPELIRPNPLKHYPLGTQILGSQLFSQTSWKQAEKRIVSLIESYNCEPMLPGNGFILFNKVGKIFSIGAPLSPTETLLMLKHNKPFIIRLARVRPSGENRLRCVKLCPIPDFQYLIENPRSLVTWWQNVGTNFCDGVF